jgi:hypothetical protein
MIELSAVNWKAMSHAYGSAENIPILLLRAENDTRGGHVDGSTWFELWSALCHQGDTYTASYAAVPFLVQLAERPNYQSQYDPLLLAASIEVSMLEGNGPDMPDDLVMTYRNALAHGLDLAERALKQPLDRIAQRAYRGCVAAFLGQSLTARNIWDEET